MTGAASSVNRSRLLGGRAASLLQRNGALVALVAAVLVGATRFYAFSTPENLINVLRQNSMLGLVALGMTFVILSGGIDLSAGALLAVAGVLSAQLGSRGSLVGLVGGVGAAAGLGLVNGIVVTKARIQPFIATLAMMTAARGATLAATGEESVRLGGNATGLVWLGRGDLGHLPVPIVLFLLAYGVGWVALRYTRFGRHVFAVGDSEEASRLMGLPVDRIIVATYTISGSLAGLAGVILAARLGAGQPVAGMGWELDAIAAVVVGGTLLTGGEGGAGSTLIGVLLLGIVFNLFNLEGTISPWWQWVMRGVFLLFVVVVQSYLQRRDANG